MKGRWEPERVENPASPGTPDVYYTMHGNGKMGWIELKHVHKWPARKTTTIKVEHFTDKQKSFIRRHGRAGAQVHVLIQVEKEYFLFGWRNAQRIGELVKTEFYTECHKFWKNRINYDELELILKTWS